MNADKNTEYDVLKNYDEAKAWLAQADLQTTVLVLEDWCDGEKVANGLLGGGPDEYTFSIRNHEGEEERYTEVDVDQTEAAEIIGGWKVAGRKGV